METFIVKSDLRSTSGMYEVVDENGAVACLQGAEEFEFYKGKKLCCNVISPEGGRPVVVLARKPVQTGSAFSVSYEYLKGLLPDKEWRDSIVHLLLYNAFEETFETRAYTWLITHTEGLHGEELNEFLCSIRGALMDMLERSDLMKAVSGDEVDIIADRISLISEHTAYICAALQKVTAGDEDEYVGDIISKLSKSGFLYHPKKHFSCMTYIFRLQPMLMQRRMADLLSALRTNNVNHWRREPFRSEIIKQLEMYVDIAQKSIINDDRDTWSQIFEALAIQLLMADEQEELVDVNLNLARMSRAGSYFRYANPTRMADMALDALQGLIQKRFVYSLEDTAHPEVLYHKMVNWYRSLEISREQVSTYNAHGLLLEISDNRITLRPDSDNPQVKSVLSSKDNIPTLWKGLDILLERGAASRVPSVRKGVDKMSSLKKVWKSIEDGLFDPERIQKADVIKTKKAPKVGDTVLAYAYKMEDDNTLRCMVSDDEFFGQGLLSVRSDEKIPGMVSYYPAPEIEDFRSEDGNPLLLRLKVVAIEADGTLIFDAKNRIFEYIRNNKPHFLQKCIIGKSAGENIFLAVSEGGFPTVVYVDDEDRENIHEGTHVEVAIDGTRWFVNGFMQGRFQQVIDADFTVEDAFYDLVSAYAEDELEESEDEIKEVALDKSHIGEIIDTLDRLSSVADDETAYCYVAFAAALSRLIGDQARASGFAKQMEMTYLLHRFAVTDSVDPEELALVQDECLGDDETRSSLRRLFNQLLIVSYIGKDNDALCERLSGVKLDDAAETLKGYVYSYNVLLAAGLPVEGLKALIKQTLNLTGQEGYVKKYEKGESQTVEFKTSIIYPAGSMKADLKAQTRQVMKEVCAFLNRDGGTLYLGVNDFGVGVGLADDMSNALFADSRDKYDRYVRDQITAQLGQAANHCVHSYFDEEACGRDVYVLEIQPCERAVSLDGVYYERQGSSSRKVAPEYLDMFLRSKAPKGQSDVNPGQEPDSDPVSEPASDSGVMGTQPVQEKEIIPTGRLRNNVLHYYDQNYDYSTAMYLHFYPDFQYKVSKEDTYEEDSTLLTLNLHSGELSNHVITVYDDGAVSKVPVSRFLEKAERQLHNCYDGASPVFVCPADKDDILYVAYEHKGTVYHRLENVADLHERGVRDAGEMLFDVAFDRILKAEILPDSFRSDLPKVITSRKKLGNFWKVADTNAMVAFLEEKGVR